MRLSEIVKKVNGGYFNVFVSTFGENDEQWDLFLVGGSDFPDEEYLDKYDSLAKTVIEIGFEARRRALGWEWQRM